MLSRAPPNPCRRSPEATPMKPHVARIALAGSLLSLIACSTEKVASPKTCCEQPQIPAGVPKFAVVDESVTGPSDGERVVMRVGLAQPVKRDAIYPVLHTLYRHAMKRNAFEPIHFVAEIYADEASAKQGGKGSLATVTREQSDIAPKCDNRIPYDFTEQAERAFAASLGNAHEEDMNDTCHLADKKKAARFDDRFTHKPSIAIDPARFAVEITYPYLDDGKDEYIKELKYTSALKYWIEFVTSMFRKVDTLKEVTYVGVHNDQPAVKISVSRADFQSKLASLQEDIAAHSAITFGSLGMGKATDQGAEKEQKAFHTKTYKAALATLPKTQVSVSPKLK